MNSKIPVAVLGATGIVGQRMVALLAQHPLFEIVQVAASQRSQGKTYGEAVHWLLDTPIPEAVRSMVVTDMTRQSSARVALSALDAEVAFTVEKEWAKAGVAVISNASAHRMDPLVPLLIPEVNGSHSTILPKNGGFIVTNPNCVVIGLCLALKPLVDRFGLSDVSITTFQSISGAGFPGVASLSIMDNLIPYISNEESKVEAEPKKIFGVVKDGTIQFDTSMNVSATCVRVPVTEGHLKAVSVRLKRKTSSDELIQAWKDMPSLDLPSSPEKLLYYHDGQDFPQPKLHRLYGKGMSVSIGRLRPCSLLEHKFLVLSHNTIRGAAGGSILIAELLVQQDRIV